MTATIPSRIDTDVEMPRQFPKVTSDVDPAHLANRTRVMALRARLEMRNTPDWVVEREESLYAQFGGFVVRVLRHNPRYVAAYRPPPVDQPEPPVAVDVTPALRWLRERGLLTQQHLAVLCTDGRSVVIDPAEWDALLEASTTLVGGIHALDADHAQLLADGRPERERLLAEIHRLEQQLPGVTPMQVTL